jgi:hypothetical protein
VAAGRKTANKHPRVELLVMASHTFKYNFKYKISCLLGMNQLYLYESTIISLLFALCVDDFNIIQ